MNEEIQQLIKEGREFTAKLTPGKWESKDCGCPDCWCKYIDSDGNENGVCNSGALSRNDADGIAWMHNNLPRILELLEGKNNDRPVVD